MGTDIGGWVEVKQYTSWYGVIRVQDILDRHYDMFGCLFGVRNYAGFVPVVEQRGMPDDASHEVKDDWWHTISKAHTWISWEEIRGIDWDEPAEKLDQRVHYYQRDENGEWRFYQKAAGGYPPHIKVDKEQAIEIDGILYKVERMVRRDALVYQWEFLFKMMEMLAERYGAENVRLVVWFDN
jgi:hypothetical protein